MPETKLGTKHQCFSCGTKFYDLGKSESICPKCGANQKDAVTTEAPSSQASRRKRKVEIVKAPVETDDVEPIEDLPEEGELVGADLEDDEVEEEEEEFDEES